MRLVSNYTIDVLAGQQVLMPAGQAVLDGGTLFSLNASGSWYAQQLSNEITFEQLKARAVEHFSASGTEDVNRICTDLKTFLASLQAKGLLEGAEGSVPQ